MQRYKVNFTHTSQGQRGVPILRSLRRAFDRHGPNLPAFDLDGDGFQVRDLNRIGRVWSGVFAKLRSDAPNIISANDQERAIDLADGDRVVDKCHFLYREQTNVLIWQINRNAGGLSKAQQYLSQVFDQYVALPVVTNNAELERVLQGQIYELSFSYARPAHLIADIPIWTRNQYNLMEDVNAAQAKFLFRAHRGGSLYENTKRMVRELVQGPEFDKVRVRLTDESDPIDLFMAPLKENISVNLVGRYPVAQEVFEQLEQAYDRQRNSIPPFIAPDPED